MAGNESDVFVFYGAAEKLVDVDRLRQLNPNKKTAIRLGPTGFRGKVLREGAQHRVASDAILRAERVDLCGELAHVEIRVDDVLRQGRGVDVGCFLDDRQRQD